MTAGESGAPKYLVIAPAWVGDLVMADSLLALLKARHACEIHCVAPPSTYPLLERLPECDAGFKLAVGHGELGLGKRWRLARSLPGPYERAYVLPNTLKSALLPWFAGVRRRTGWRGEARYGLLNDLRRLDGEALPLMVQRFCALAADGGAIDPADCPRPRLLAVAERQQRLLEELGLGGEARVLGLCPGAEFGPSKRWPEANFAAVAAAHIRSGGRVWLFGSTRDRDVTQRILALLPQDCRPQCFDLAGRTSLPDAVDLLALTERVLTNDSGLMHVAAALGRPLVAIFGSTSPAFTPPLGDRVTILRVGLPCSPCFQRECRFGHLDCLRLVTPETALAALARLAEPAAGSLGLRS